MKYLLDTDTFSQIVKGQDAKIIKRMETLHTKECLISVITHGEIIYGLNLKTLKPATQQRIAKLLEVIHTAPLTTEAATQYGKLRAHMQTRDTPIGPNDLWIAAHALAANLVLVTNNTREFSRVPKIKIENWVGK